MTRSRKVAALVVLPATAIAMTAGAAYFKYESETASASRAAGTEAVAAAGETIAAMLTYTPDTVEQTLTAAQLRLTGSFHDEYTQLMHDEVIPEARQRQVRTVASIPALGVIHAESDKVLVLAYVNQHAAAGAEPPTDTATTVRATLEKVDGRWLISGFEPI
ncbi:hypothetical protein [[Mycobacterium] burgundiense]|uniref:Twin-arginine translocation pathway signal n=1 Tax=[Mycobacterium] burgundiense TaxID=3064286 RepID=A0ABM9LB56_9MYCO|nr:hypothetical protein [Mycolicibacterium sp. MU0053]CAJ1496038.1 hypothetical protein MU0053_000548 [Mycolicibacterium sp. MU0053]